jgi:hypothetical protein
MPQAEWVFATAAPQQQKEGIHSFVLAKFSTPRTYDASSCLSRQACLSLSDCSAAARKPADMAGVEHS